MKSKIFFAAILCFILVDFGSAQVRFGARVSGNMSNMTTVHSYSKSRGGFQVGAMAMIPVTNNDILFFQPEVNFSQQGEYDQPRKQDGTSERQRIFVNFVNIPLNAKVYFTDAYSEFFAIGGPYLGFQVFQNTDKMDYATEADDNDYPKFDFGFMLGAGYSLNRNVEFSLRYNYGFVDQVKNDVANASNSTSVLNVGVSYFLP